MLFVYFFSIQVLSRCDILIIYGIGKEVILKKIEIFRFFDINYVDY